MFLGSLLKWCPNPDPKDTLPDSKPSTLSYITASPPLQLIGSELSSKVTAFDPTADGSENIPVEAIGEPLEGRKSYLYFRALFFCT